MEHLHTPLLRLRPIFVSFLTILQNYLHNCDIKRCSVAYACFSLPQHLVVLDSCPLGVYVLVMTKNDHQGVKCKHNVSGDKSTSVV